MDGRCWGTAPCHHVRTAGGLHKGYIRRCWALCDDAEMGSVQIQHDEGLANVGSSCSICKDNVVEHWREGVGGTASFHHDMAASGLHIDYRYAIVGELTQRSSYDDAYIWSMQTQHDGSFADVGSSCSVCNK